MNKISTRFKLLYGLGFAAKGIKDGLFQLFVFFYFSQVLGLDAALAGTATIIALLFDAISDPLVGLISDRWQSAKWGRRHPFMFASALPLGLFTWLLFLPPEGLSQMGLFWWLTVFAILLRFALTLFLVPSMSLGAELSEDYNERTSIMSYRIMFGAFVPPFVILFGLLTFFVPKEGMENGLFNVEAYPKFALLCAVLMIVSILVSTWGTRTAIPHLIQRISKSKSAENTRFLQKLKVAFDLKSYRTMLGFTVVMYVAMGIGIIFTPYFVTYFFGLSEKELAILPISSALAGVLSLWFTPWMGKKLDKKNAAIVSTILFSFFFSLPFNFRLLGIFPENGDPMLLVAYVVSLLFAYLFVWVALSLANSMMADIVDEYELKTNQRQEGMFFSSISFAYKCSSGLGFFFAGLLLNFIAFPKQAKVSEVSAEAINGLGLIGGPVLMVIYLLSLFFLLNYPIDRERFEEIRRGLGSR